MVLVPDKDAARLPPSVAILGMVQLGGDLEHAGDIMYHI